MVCGKTGRGVEKDRATNLKKNSEKNKEQDRTDRTGTGTGGGWVVVWTVVHSGLLLVFPNLHTVLLRATSLF